MKVLVSAVLFMLLTGCSTMPSYESGDIKIRTSQLRERTLKIMLYDQQRASLDQATITVTNSRGDILENLELRRRVAFFQYPMHESSVFIEVSNDEGLKGTRQFFRSQLREVRITDN